MIRTVLLVDDDASVREALGQTLDLADLRPILAGSTIEAKDHISPHFAGIVVTDVRMPGKDGFALLDHVREIDPDLPVILLTGEGDIPMAVRGMGAGAFDFLEKPCAPGDLLRVIEKALRTRALVMENRQLRHRLHSGDAAARMIFGVSPQSETLRERVRAVARTRAEVLITGEPGTGIPKVAEVIHLLSSAGQSPFVKLAAAAVTPDMLARDFARAEDGAIFFDEIGALSAPAQFALHELLEEEFGRGTGVRVLAGTHRDLDAEVAAGRFHPDLFYKLDAMRVHIPPLRARPEDIPVVFRHYVAQAAEEANLTPPEITEAVLAPLMAQDWPGNARALRNVAMRFALGIEEPGDGAEALGLAGQMARVERTLLEQALRRHGGNATMAAQALQLPRKTFYDKLARHGLRPENFRP